MPESVVNRIGRENPPLMRFSQITVSYAGRQESHVPIGDNLPYGSNRATISVPSRILRQSRDAVPHQGS
jgi:hypothetical protein